MGISPTTTFVRFSSTFSLCFFILTRPVAFTRYTLRLTRLLFPGLLSGMVLALPPPPPPPSRLPRVPPRKPPHPQLPPSRTLLLRPPPARPPLLVPVRHASDVYENASPNKNAMSSVRRNSIGEAVLRSTERASHPRFLVIVPCEPSLIIAIVCDIAIAFATSSRF